jgi:hypothetical protein
MGRKSTDPKISQCQSLTALARDCDFVLFEMAEIGLILKLGADSLATCKKLGCPFPFNKSRPEWVLEFLKTHPDLSCKDKPAKVPVPPEKIVSISSAKRH